ncbi:MAG TPA: hypothetical protein VFA77_17545, partial [Candidatus Eisenbacteria bacterium]|nr:hypothetical protein [Candidatus Eisenbacteria bacterium]
MPESNTSGNRVKNILLHRKWTKVCGALVLLVLIAYFVVTSSAFVTGVVLPRVSRSLNARITVSHASVVRAFSQVVLSDVKIYTTESEPLFAAQDLRVRYHLWDLVHRKINVRQLLLVSPSVQVVCNADGTSNLDPLFQAITKPTTERGSRPGQSASPFQLDLKNLVLANAKVRMVKTFKDRSREVTELANARITLTQLANAQPGSINVASDLKFDRQAGTTNDLLQGRLTASYDFSLSQDLRPQSLNGNSRFEVLLAGGALKDLSALGALMEIQATSTEITKATIRFAQAGRPVGTIAISGPFTMEKREGRLRLDVESIDRRALNLLGAARGLDFGATTLTSTNEIELAQGGAYLVAKGRLSARRLSVTQNAQTTPALDLNADYAVTLDREKKFALVEGFKLSSTQNQRPFLTGELTRPMNLVWGKTANEIEDSTFTLRATNLNFAEWRPFVGDLAGNASVNFKLLSQLSGKKLQIELTSRIDGFRAKLANRETE